MLSPGRLRRRAGPLPPAEPGLADASRAVPSTVLIFLVLDIGTTMVWQASGVSDLGDTGPAAAVQGCALIAAAAATMWHRPRVAVLASAVVVLLVFWIGPAGEELWLLIIVGVTAAIRADRWQLGLVLLAQIGYVVCFAYRVERAFPGGGWAAFGGLLVVVSGSLVLGLVARQLLRARDRRRNRVRELERERTEIRAAERARLADELQLLVTQGLVSITDELDRVARRPADLPGLRAGLDQIGRGSSLLLDQLRVLLDVLRSAPPPESGPRPDPPGSGWRRAADALTARHVRIATSVVLGLFALRAAVGDLGAPGDQVWVQVGGLLACALAVWRPGPAAGCAVAVVSASALLGTGGYWDVLSTTVLCLIAAVGFRPRGFWTVVLAVAGYTGLLGFVDRSDPLDHVLLVGLAGFGAVLIGLAARHLVTARRRSLHQLAELAAERERMESEERSAVARELHDVVAHALSVTAMLVMATSASTDPERLTATVAKVRRSVDDARHELSTLVGALRGPDDARSPVLPLATPLASAAALADRLAEHGFRPVLDLDPVADALDITTQRTLSRILTEAATNVLRYAPTGSECRITLRVVDGTVSLGVVSPATGESEAAGGRGSGLSLGRGLVGIRERVELTGGTFRAGLEQGHWTVAVTLPVAPAHPSPEPTTAWGYEAVRWR